MRLFRCFMFFIALTWLTCDNCSAQKIRAQLSPEKDSLFNYYLRILDSAAKSTPQDTIYHCCIGPISFMEVNTNVLSEAPGTFAGKFYFTRRNLIAWHKWYKKYRIKK